MKDITILIPIHKFDKTIEEYINTSFSSVLNTVDTLKSNLTVKYMIVCPKDVQNELSSLSLFQNVSDDVWVIADKETDFCSMVNKGVDECNTEYFSVIEFDDKFTPNALNSFIPYIETNESDTKVFLSIQELYDASNEAPEAVGYINETAWASAFSEEIGFLDIESLEAYYNFNVTGAIINTQFFKEIGGLKSSIKISFWYEFLLRSLYNSGKVFVVPKVCYQHTVNRVDSLTDEYTKTISQEEGAWWINLAQEEYFFKKDRNKKYPKTKE
jgi:hypothetical protein